MVAAGPGMAVRTRPCLSTRFRRWCSQTAWKSILAQKGWADTFLAGADFQTYLNSEIEKTTGTLKRLRHHPVTDGGMAASLERRQNRQVLVVALLLITAGAIVAWDAAHADGVAAYSPDRSACLPYAIAAGLVMLGLWTALGGFREAPERRQRPKFVPMAWIMGVLIAQIALLRYAGFAIATGAVFAATAKAFGRGPLWFNYAVGLVMSLAIWLFFSRGLQLVLPAGPLEAAASRAVAAVWDSLSPRSSDEGELVDTFWALWQGLLVAVQPLNLLYALIGVTLGTAVGVLPGIGPALTIALLLPITFKLDPAGSLIMFAGIYYGGMYGGSTTSILSEHAWRERVDSDPPSKGTRWRRPTPSGGPALATAAIGSFVAGTLATIALAFVAPSW